MDLPWEKNFVRDKRIMSLFKPLQCISTYILRSESFKQKVERLKLQIPEDFSWSFPLLQLCLFEHKRSSGQGADPKMQYV